MVLRLANALLLLVAISCVQVPVQRVTQSTAPGPSAVWDVAALRIRGEVADSSGEAMSGIVIGLSSCASESTTYCSDAFSPGATTDSAGRFSVDLPRAGRYALIGVVDGVIDGYASFRLPQDSARVLRLTVSARGRRTRR